VARGPIPPQSFPDNPVVAALIRAKAHKLARDRLLPPGDQDDIAQDLTLDLTRRFRDYDPASGDPVAFARVVVSHCISRLQRDRWAAKRDDSQVLSLDSILRRNERGVVDPRAESDATRMDLSLDLAEVLAQLPTDQQKIAAAILASDSIAAAARELGLPRFQPDGRTSEAPPPVRVGGVAPISANRSSVRRETGYLTNRGPRGAAQRSGPVGREH
jgi:RNA polymerase sigma-70 factor (ECF subfamily)